MRLLMTMVVRDEEDVLEACLDFHLAQGVNFVLALDNGSVDATPEILRGYAERGVLRVLHGEPGIFPQARWVTLMARLAATEHGADWVLDVDADEFFWPVAGTLPDVLAAVPSDFHVVHVPRAELEPVPGEEPFWRRMTVRRAVYRTPLGRRPLPLGVAHRAHPEVVVAEGNHTASAPGFVLAPLLTPIDGLHAPARSFAQFERKVRNHAGHRPGTPGVGPEVGEENRHLEQRRRAGELRELYAALEVTAERRARGLADGTLVEDHRLHRFLDAGSARRPSRSEATEAVAAAYDDMREWTAARTGPLVHARDALRERLSHAEGRIAELDHALAATDASLRAEREAHFRTAEDLRLLRSSRALRMTAAVRRLAGK